MFPPVGFALLGSDILGTFYFNLQNRQQQPAVEPLIVGTPPKELRNNHDDELFTIEHLPPGDYKLIQLSPRSSAPNAVTDASNKPLAEFSLKEGQTLELNELKFTVPIPSKEDLEQMPQDYYGYDSTEDEQDKVEVFKP